MLPHVQNTNMNTVSGERAQAAEAKEIVLRYIQLVNEGRLDEVSSVVNTENFTDINPFSGEGHGRAAFDALINSYKSFVASMPDLRMDAHVPVAEGDTVLIKGGMSGTHVNGPVFGVPPTGKKLAWKAFGMMRVVDGKVVHHELVADVMSLMQQLGLIPANNG